jgi:ketosteroid isomerase-like protein
MKAKVSILLAGVVLVSLLSAVTGCASKVNDPAALQAIQKCVDDYAKALNAADADAIVAMMSDNIVFADINIPALTGQAAVKKFHQDFFGSFSAIELSMPVADLRVSGALGAARGTWTAKFTFKSELLAQSRDSGSWSGIFLRQSDGSWKWESVVVCSDQPLPGSSSGGVEESALLQLEQEWADAIVKSDSVAWERFVAKEWTYYFEGQVMTKPQAAAEIKSGAYKIESFQIGDFTAHVFGDAAIVTTTAVMKGKYKGADIPAARSIDFFVKREGRWQAISTQNTIIEP